MSFEKGGHRRTCLSPREGSGVVHDLWPHSYHPGPKQSLESQGCSGEERGVRKGVGASREMLHLLSLTPSVHPQSEQFPNVGELA